MDATRDDSRAGTESRRWRVLSWLTAALVIAAVGFAGASNAEAHPVQHQYVHGDMSEPHDIAEGAVNCCHETEHSADTCSVHGQCVVCAVGHADISAPPLSVAARPGLRLTFLSAGLGSSLAGRPPQSTGAV